jgi:glucose-1-phosphate thymidylyltransferase
MKGLILAGGLGKRLRPLTHTGSKQTIPIANKPVLHYCVEDLVNADIKDIGIIVGYTPDRIKNIKEVVGDGSLWGAKITYIEQDAPRGLAHAIYIAKDFVDDDNFVVYLGDNMLKGGIKDFVKDFVKTGAHAKLLLSEVENPSQYGNVTLDENGNIIDIEEKPKKPKSNLAITGVYLFRPDIFEFAKNVKPDKNGEVQITDAIKMMWKSPKHKVIATIINGWWDDLGRTEDILKANYMVLSDLKESENRGMIEENVSLIGVIKIGDNTLIRKNSIIRGPVIIGKNCKIGPDTYIGPYTSIGDNTTIIDGEIESSIVFGDTMINCKGKIVDSLIGKNSTISSSNRLPKGYRLVIGENSLLNL